MKFSKKYIKLLSALLAALLLLSAAACSGEGSNNAENTNPSGDNTNEKTESGDKITDESGYFTKADLNPDYDTSSATKITLDDDNTKVDGKGASYSGGVLKITMPGKYYLKGKLTDGQIVVTVSKEDKVTLLLDGVDVTCSNSSAINVTSASKVFITLNSGSENTFSDGSTYKSDLSNACIYSKDDLSINGSGKLTVNGNYNNAIGTKNDLKIVDATIVASAKNNALKGNDSVRIYSGNITVNSEDDGIKASNELEEGKGYVYIAGGDITITSGDDGIQAPTSVTAIGGKIDITHGGKVINCTGKVDTKGAALNDTKK